jgi:hypothetical protein
MRRGTVILAAGLAALGTGALAAPHMASAQGTLDANCPGPETIAFPSGEDARWAQSFTALTSGSLVRAETEVGKAGPAGDFAMQILATDAAGDPTNTVLASTTIPDALVPTGNSRISGVFSSPASVVAGEQYAFVITRPGEEFTVRDRGDNPCPGAEYLSVNQTAPFGGADTCCDLIFAVFVEPPAAAQPQPEPLTQPPSKADGTLTIDANKGKVEKGRKVTLSGQYDTLANEACEPDREVEIQRRLKSQDDSKFTTFQTVTTDAAGKYSLREQVKKTYFYRAAVGETEACDDELSNSQKVRVQKKKAAREA